MTFTTPPIASEPYTADAPSLSTSMRSMTEAGMEFRSTDEFAPVPPGTKRRPLTSTSVLPAPSPRRLIRVDPSPPLLAWVLMALDWTVRVWSTSPMEESPNS